MTSVPVLQKLAAHAGPEKHLGPSSSNGGGAQPKPKKK